jgi:gliding motility-associated-like protein
VWQTASGGGGGGGYYGGGGGGNDGCCTGANGGGGGGGGSSLVPAGGTCLANNNNNHGYVTINFQAGGINISASNTGPYCAGQTISLSATAGATTYSWTGPNGFTSNLQNPTIPNATPLDSGTYTLNYTTPNCNGTASTLVVVNTPINPAFTQINPICHNGAVPALPGTSNNVPTAITGTWNPPTISSASPGTFTYTFTPAAQFCANPATMNITILPNETPTFTQINPMCINSAPPVLPNPSTNATPYTGTWSPPTITTASAGSYTYTFTPNAGQCAVATTMNISILNYTYPTFQQIGPLCQFTQGVQLPASSTNITPITGNWSPANINTQQPGIFTYNFTPNPFQCSDTASMVIVINPLIIPQFTPMPLVCQGDIPPVFPLVSNNNPVIVGTWNPPTIDSSVPGTFTFDFTPSPNQCADSVSMNVIVVPSVPPSFVADTISGCNPLLVNFTSNPVAGASYTYLWNGNTIGTGPVIDYMFTAAGCHTITLQYNLQGCIETTTYTDYICMENYPNTSFTASPNVLSSTSETINFNNNTIGAINYLWEFGDGQTSSEFEGPHFYNGITENILVTLTGTTALGCATSFEVSLPVISDPIYYVPNTFTPDQDEHNQTWYPVFTTGYDPYNFNLKIYNRWGETVWESNDSKGEWDGTYGTDGTKVQAGIYTWIIRYANKETDEKKIVTGFVNILR